MMYNTHMKDRGFEIFNHDGIVKMRVWGKTLEDLFRNSIRGLASYFKEGILDAKKAAPEEPHDIRVEAVDINSLLGDCLSRVIAESDICSRVFFDIRFTKFGENFLEGVLSGVPAEEFDNEIKAVSYSEVDIKKNTSTGYFETLLVFDV
ncbi:MAG: hypothetical protein A2847_01715 [Candidatus Sungbacteria bacterium RIFCSPHIGHO2_01_FULL_50_25]|uniref:Archease domain-containing protein n=1 Tax=Candidatus Sungbacteria bacterium RIFCSPHIGHO2_01_FULL_50_25 TaxID=1802265 RepID=A0A1G2KES2_9BACT|nr:MAG: hypothetical protein A2847_01715 [Candidatus Sungbacteria bacterium RIFCSPHIGHO2_01_FULL_50_25]